MPEPSDFPQPRLSYVIARLERILRQRIAKGVEPYGLNVSQYTALSILGRRSGLSNAQLARRTYISPQAMNQVLDQLTQAGLVERQPHATHGRILKTELTAEGRTVLKRCDAAIDAVEAEMLQNMSKEESQALLQSLLKSVRSLHGGFERVES
ncbi:MAG: MarR family transcriptional regulator [Caldilineaceae bacterium]